MESKIKNKYFIIKICFDNTFIAFAVLLYKRLKVDFRAHAS